MTTSGFSGILPAIVTPFDENENFHQPAFELLVERLYTHGIDGLYVNGQTGEGLLQPVEQRKRVAEVALRLSPAGKQVIIHVGAYRTADAVALARHAATIGAHAISSLPPLGSYTFAEIRAYYEALAAASDLPVLVYYFPAVCPAIQAKQQVLELLEIPNVIGLKFTDFDLYKMSQIKQRGCVIFNGHDEVLIAGLLMGADGGIGTFYNLVPELFVQAFSLARHGRWEEAKQVQRRINELVEIGLRFPLMPAVKTMLRWSGIDCGQCLQPRRALTPQEESDLREALRASSFAHLAA
ncbi:MAG TPA: dihydrodipicolinate synthase family protein [Candidatus Sulfopaludibacter sp.]|jgi:N-acetylneuraminate lyase|nr:dihydrodipicolinate synthase family protein [Candidatus Sulfopaludibacter sp.]